MQRSSPRVFLLVLSGVILSLAQFAPAENLQQLIKDLAVQKTAGLDRQLGNQRELPCLR